MPKAPSKPQRKYKTPTHWVFRLVSNRGTDITECIFLPAGITKSDAKRYSEEWADLHTRGTAIEEYTVYYKRVFLDPRPSLLKKWDRLCKQRARINERWAELRAKLMPHDWTKR